MKNAVRKAIVMATGVFALLSASAYGQTNDLRVNIPFKFHAANGVLPAGEYTVRLDAMTQRVLFRQLDGTAAMYLGARLETTPMREDGAAVFHQYGDTYILQSIRAGSTSWAYRVGRTKLERELASANPYPKVASIKAVR